MQVVGDQLAPSPVEDAAGAAKCLGGQGSPGPGKFRGALLHASSLYGIHPGNEMVPGMFSGDRYWDLIGGRTTEGASTEMRADIVNFFATTYGSLCIGSETVRDSWSVVRGLPMRWTLPWALGRGCAR